MARDVAPPVLDDWLAALENVAKLLREAFDNPGTVTRGQLRKALVTYERLDCRATRAAGGPLSEG